MERRNFRRVSDDVKSYEKTLELVWSLAASDFSRNYFEKVFTLNNFPYQYHCFQVKKTAFHMLSYNTVSRIIFHYIRDIVYYDQYLEYYINI